MKCRVGCGACCISPSIGSAIPGMPAGKPAGVRCVALDSDNRCLLFSSAQRPLVCKQFQADPTICGETREQAIALIAALEVETQA